MAPNFEIEKDILYSSFAKTDIEGDLKSVTDPIQL